MHVTLSRRTLVLAIVLIVAIVALAFLSVREKEPSAAKEAGTTPTVPNVRATMEAHMTTPMAWTMSDGVQAVRGRATFVGEGQGGYAYVTVQSGELEFTFIVPPQTGVFYSADVFSHPNQPAPTAENPQAALRNLLDTPVQVRYDPGDPPVARSILIIGDRP